MSKSFYSENEEFSFESFNDYEYNFLRYTIEAAYFRRSLD